MRLVSIRSCCALAVLLAVHASADPIKLRVMTYNLRYASMAGENNWPVRRPILTGLITREDPDLIGTQEGLFIQLKDIEHDLPQYRWIGLGRGGGSREEFMAIFYKHERFEPLAYDHFWLSDTPAVIGSRTWGNNNRRMVTWVRFRDLESGEEFVHWNTHFDHEVQEAREKSADLLQQRLSETKPSRPTIVTGDFNADQDNVVHAKMVGGSFALRDSWDIASKRGDWTETFNGFREPKDGGRRIDWVLVSPEITCSRAEVITYREGNQFPSDHFPVVCDLTVSQGQRLEDCI